MLIHSHRKNTSVVIDFRETAPKSARPDRYMGNPKSSQVGRGSIGKEIHASKKNAYLCHLWPGLHRYYTKNVMHNKMTIWYH